MGTDSAAGRTRPGPQGPAHGRLPRGEFAIAAVLLAFCAGVYALTARFESVPVALSLNMPPTYFPRLLVGTIAVLTGVLLIEALGRPAKVRAPIAPMVLVTAGGLVLAVAAVRPLGLLVTLYLLSAAFPLLWRERRGGFLLAFVVLFPTALYLLFAKVLEVQFPRGLLLRWLGL